MRNWGIKFKVGSALRPTTQAERAQKLSTTAARFPSESDSVYIHMHIKAVCQHFSGFKRAHYSTTDITRIMCDKLSPEPKPHLLRLPPQRCYPLCFLLFITKHQSGLDVISAVCSAVDLSEILILMRITAAGE